MEGIAMDWLYGYHAVSQIYNNLYISCNNKQFNDELNVIKDYGSVYLPNIYRPSFDPCDPPDYVPRDAVIDVGCFGAIRPLKNQFLQAIAAIMFAKKLRRRMNFHIITLFLVGLNGPLAKLYCQLTFSIHTLANLQRSIG
jgi:hypothetical protein